MSCKKCAYIRKGDETSECPFGLPITKACKNAGETVEHMCPLSAVPEEKREQIEKANKRVYVHGKRGSRCIYASHIFEDQEAVNCNFGDHAQGIPSTPMVGSPLYPQTFSGIGLDSLYAFPLGWYADNNTSRNLPYGLFSLVGELTPVLIKHAVSNTNTSLWEKMQAGDELSKEEADELANILEKCRQDYEEGNITPAKLRELANEYNSRKYL